MHPTCMPYAITSVWLGHYAIHALHMQAGPSWMLKIQAQVGHKPKLDAEDTSPSRTQAQVGHKPKLDTSPSWTQAQVGHKPKLDTSKLEKHAAAFGLPRGRDSPSCPQLVRPAAPPEPAAPPPSPRRCTRGDCCCPECMHLPSLFRVDAERMQRMQRNPENLLFI